MSESSIKSPRKLIEVALPLDAINAACAQEKSIRQGHPSSLHLWWARRPLAAARSVIFAQLVNDPGYQQGSGFKYGKNKKDAAIERKRLFKIIEDLALWENVDNEEVLERARAEIRRSWHEVCQLNKGHPEAKVLFNPEKLPGLHDPFAGGGAIPLEAQRLGLEAHASDLNPVAVIINKAMIEIPPRFTGRPPIHPADKSKLKAIESQREWAGVTGLSEDIRYYGAWIRKEAQKRIGNLYPPVEVTAEMAKDRPDLEPLVGQKLTVIAWLWARTVKSPDPAFSHVDVPLASSFILSSKEDKQAYVIPVIKGDEYNFVVKMGTPPSSSENGTKLSRGANFRCILSDAAIEPSHIKAQGISKCMGSRLMAIVADSPRGRVYLSPSLTDSEVAQSAKPTWHPGGSLVEDARAFTPTLYGINSWSDMFTSRQLVGLSSFCELIEEVRELIKKDALEAGMAHSNDGIDDGGTGAAAYAEAVSVYLAFGLDKMADLGNAFVRWEPIAQCPRQLFGRQAIPMIWDFAEANPLGSSSGAWEVFIDGISKAFANSFSRTQPWFRGSALQADAQTQTISKGNFVSSDPPYYDNIPYADLSDFFYPWLRRNLKTVFPRVLTTIVAPKEAELVATSYRHGGRVNAEAFFLSGMTSAMRRLSEEAHPEAPITIYYAFKQSETSDESGTTSTGWVTFLGAVIQAGLLVNGTWPLRTENASRMRGQASNALASSVVLVCRRRPAGAPSISRREFIRELNSVLPEALDEMTKGSGDERSPVAPVDLSQAIIGPGMAVFSKYSSILEADGSSMSVRTALQLINRFLAEDDFDADTQFCLGWFEKYGWKDGLYGDAETLATGKGTSVNGVKDAGVIQSGTGKVRLFKWSEYPADWDPLTDNRTPVWEALHHLIRALKRDGGEAASGALLASLGGKAEAVRQLAYRLYTLCERLGQAEDARAYNELITSWTGIETAAAAAPKPTDGQLPGFESA